jgi:hypothetical protein
VPASLLLLAAVPALGGIYRVLHLSLGGEATPANQRFFDAPTPVVLHGVACALFVFLGAFQFTPGSRRNPRRHRLRGMLFVPSALVVATTGLWMEAYYELPAYDGDLLSVFRAVFGTAMIATTLLGVRALLMGAGWTVNVAFVEWILHRRARRRQALPVSGALTVLSPAQGVQGT